MRLSTVILRFSLFAFLLFFITFSFAANAQKVNIQAIPTWVIQHQVNEVDAIPIEKIQDGIFYRLIDKQIRVTASGDQSSYTRYVDSIINDSGLDQNSQINIKYDPEYQEITLNSLYILRDGQKLDRTKSAQMSILNQESELKNQIYNGKLTLNILINDLRVGDSIDYSYTRNGSNPVFSKIFSYRKGLTWSVPVHEQHLRILWGKQKPLFITTRNIKKAVESQQLDEFVEYKLRVDNAPTVNEPSETPSWYDPYASIFFSEINNWKQVIDWARPMYQLADISVDVQHIANMIKQDHDTRAKQIVAALQYTQGSIRYVGLEMGQNSHLPSAPQQTIARGYGDCKDKTLLLIAILKALNIEAVPALVNTDDTKLTNELPPRIRAFNHVIVSLMHNNQRVWLDPTLAKQVGDLANIYQANYAYALLLDENQDALTAMETDSGKTSIEINENFVIPKFTPQIVKFSVKTTYRGYEAISKQQQILEDGLQKMSDDYEVYYQRTYPELTAESSISASTDNISGALQINEAYEIAEFWAEEEHFEAEFYPNEIRSAVFKPDQAKRNAPLALVYPNNIKFQIRLQFEGDNWEFDDEEFTQDNDFFFFKATQKFTDNILLVVYQYAAKTDHIPQHRIDDYLAARKLVLSEAYLSLIKYRLNQQSDETVEVDESNDGMLWLWGIGCVYFIALLFIIMSWRFESRHRPTFETSYFYPLTMTKFLILCIGTFGLYLNYWCYRNWKAIKTREQSDIMPIARGIFSIIWFYPLFAKLKEDSISRFDSNKILPVWLAVIFAVAIVFLSLYGNFSDGFVATFLYMLSILLFLPFVSYINLANAPATAAQEYNTKWRIRQILAIALCIPIILSAALVSSNLLPSEEVITQAEIFDHDLKFLYRKKVLPANEEIEYFYSDAVLSIRDDGNGFTQQSVFSYWIDENKVFSLDTATFAEIKNIDVEYDGSFEGTTIVTITRQDDSDFILFVSNINGGDKVFVERLKLLWKEKS